MKREKRPFNFMILTRRAALVIYDIISVICASFLALLLRFDLRFEEIPAHFLTPPINYLFINIILTLIIFYLFRLYHSLWAYASETELQNIVIAVVVSSIINAIGLQFFRIEELAVPNSYYFIYTFLLIAFIFVSRFSYRFFRGRKHKSANKGNSISVMIIGAGEAGNQIIKEIVNSSFSTMTVRCVIDDDKAKWGRFIYGVRIAGGRESIIECADIYSIDEIIVAMPSISGTELSAILEICKETNCKLRALPGIYQLVNDEVSVSRLRDVEVEDLLGRDSVQIDLLSIIGYVKGKKVLVTGAGGTIGSELCRQIATHEPAQLIMLDIYENGIYDVQQELLVSHPSLSLVVLVASVRNTNRINAIFAEHRPEIVYHAAAHKHVPLMEDSPNEAIKNNVFGTYKTALAAATNKTKRFVMISTDKAVNPTNVMGASKRISEMIIQTLDRHHETEFVAVRFGNVLGSSGSVIPFFKKQIAAGGPVTVTHPEIIRYFMTIPEAVSLVLEAGAYAKGGEIFVLDMGKPVRILDLAKNLIRLSGYTVDEDIKIEFTGLRPGEKLFEEMLMEEEGLRETANKMIFIGKPIDLDEERFFLKLNELKDVSQNEGGNIREIIQDIVPTYTINNSDTAKEY
ncbi:MAG: polysaccharide biosynthesis protein [Lachnospiraceae bacterium]|jgi:FlaA1/EpsC-like NDP-sugar epimerase|nr:polysaccharide biosynthesis protein [Lachnospiraceae bacterium]